LPLAKKLSDVITYIDEHISVHINLTYSVTEIPCFVMVLVIMAATFCLLVSGGG
jgi:hypothetical protein